MRSQSRTFACRHLLQAIRLTFLILLGGSHRPNAGVSSARPWSGCNRRVVMTEIAHAGHNVRLGWEGTTALLPPHRVAWRNMPWKIGERGNPCRVRTPWGYLYSLLLPSSFDPFVRKLRCGLALCLPAYPQLWWTGAKTAVPSDQLLHP